MKQWYQRRVRGEMEKNVTTVKTSPSSAKFVQDSLREKGFQNNLYRITPLESTLLIPVSEHVLNENLTDFLHNIRQSTQEEFHVITVPSSFLVRSKSPSNCTVVKQIREFLQRCVIPHERKIKPCSRNHGWKEEETSCFPEKWVKYGDVLLLFVDRYIRNSPDDVLNAFRVIGVCGHVRCILLHR
eukprot:TRINITY_DN265_c0_g2_i23.p1 TRINITY_DN265_c0_g2~~TRINITY_DN265_c0_g2_i23.p1  ORF type:complete len:185 (+),score=36.63 TRINITY_DN265_c0_g2_i23:92-646(+)